MREGRIQMKVQVGERSDTSERTGTGEEMLGTGGER